MIKKLRLSNQKLTDFNHESAVLSFCSGADTESFLPDRTLSDSQLTGFTHPSVYVSLAEIPGMMYALTWKTDSQIGKEGDHAQIQNGAFGIPKL